MSSSTDYFWDVEGLKNREQPEPNNDPNHPDVIDLVLHDLDNRVKAGLETYGCKLKPNNGRDALWDAYEEAQDLVLYLRQAIYERDTDKGVSDG